MFREQWGFVPGEVEVQLLPGLPVVHVVGMPDSHIRECGIRLKSALRANGFRWPRGHQIVVNLRPSYLRKSSPGIDLAIAMGLLIVTGQLPLEVTDIVAEGCVYGELTLSGEVCTPADFPRLLHTSLRPLITGVVANSTIGDGEWWSLATLRSEPVPHRGQSRLNDWQRPSVPNFEIDARAAEAILVAAHMGLHVLVAGPQGSGKSTWARTLHALTPPPDDALMMTQEEMFGSRSGGSWRPCEAPHHSVSALAMVGGGVPLSPGVISRAHGGVLIMDEFLEFDAQVLEALREPMENGCIELARGRERRQFPARFQLIATTNLCPCGRLAPEEFRRCAHSLRRCRSVCDRLSGPVLDRFDLILFSHTWLGSRRSALRFNRPAPPVSGAELRRMAEDLAQLPRDRFLPGEADPEWLKPLGLSHRKRRAMRRVARGLANLSGSVEVTEEHFAKASQWILKPLGQFNQLFG